jgi:hypothetical protein
MYGNDPRVVVVNNQPGYYGNMQMVQQPVVMGGGMNQMVMMPMNNVGGKILNQGNYF